MNPPEGKQRYAGRKTPIRAKNAVIRPRNALRVSMMEIDDLEIFENVAYIMAFHADPTIASTIDEWLEQF